MPREVLGIALLVIQVCINVPIILRLIKTKNGAGVSLAGEIIWIAGGLGWLLYGIASGSVTLTISGSLAALGCSIVSFLLIRYSKPKVVFSFVLGTFVLIAIVASYLWGGPAALSISLAIFGVAQFLPQLLVTLKAFKHRENAQGVSIGGSSFRATYTGGWAFYAGAWFIWGISFEAVDWPLFVWGLMGMFTFGLQAFQARSVRGKITEGYQRDGALGS